MKFNPNGLLITAAGIMVFAIGINGFWVATVGIRLAVWAAVWSVQSVLFGASFARDENQTDPIPLTITPKAQLKSGCTAISMVSDR